MAKRNRITRRSFVKAAGIGAAGLGTGLLALPARAKKAKKTLKILQWNHFVPGYDKWFNGTYTKEWGAKNDTEVIVDNIGLAGINARAAAEVSAQKGHDLFMFLAPPAAYEEQVIEHKDSSGLTERTGYQDEDDPGMGVGEVRYVLGGAEQEEGSLGGLIPKTGEAGGKGLGGAQRDLDPPRGREQRDGDWRQDWPGKSRQGSCSAAGSRACDGLLRDLEIRREHRWGEEVSGRLHRQFPSGIPGQRVLQYSVFLETDPGSRPAPGERLKSQSGRQVQGTGGFPGLGDHGALPRVRHRGDRGGLQDLGFEYEVTRWETQC